MKVTEQVEQLLRQGHKPKELLDLGFSKQAVTRVRRRLRAEKTAQGAGTSKGRETSTGAPQSSSASSEDVAGMQRKLASLESRQKELEDRLQALEATGVSMEDMEARLDGAPPPSASRTASSAIAVHQGL